MLSWTECLWEFQKMHCGILVTMHYSHWSMQIIILGAKSVLAWRLIPIFVYVRNCLPFVYEQTISHICSNAILIRRLSIYCYTLSYVVTKSSEIKWVLTKNVWMIISLTFQMEKKRCLELLANLMDFFNSLINFYQN